MTFCMFRIYLIVYLLFHTNWGRASIKKKIRRQCAFLSYFLIRRSRSTHFHLKKTFYVFFKKHFIREVSVHLVGRCTCTCWLNFKFACAIITVHPHQHCNVKTQRHWNFFSGFFFKFSQFFFYHIKELMEISEF